MKREEFFREQFEKTKNLRKIVIKWFIFKDDFCIPAFLEALLIQLYFKKKHKLPLWNKSF